MQITIDTHKDGPEEIRKAARLLLSLLDEELSPASPSQSAGVQDASSLFSILDTPTVPTEKKSVVTRRIGVERY